MYFPKLSPLQSRFAGSLVATLLLVLIYLSITNPQFAYAAASPDDFHQPRPDALEERTRRDGVRKDVARKGEIRADGRREPEFEGLKPGIIGRAQPGVNALKNNVPEQLNINPGDTQYWIVEKSTLWGPHAPRPLELPLVGKRRRKRQNEFDSEDLRQEGEDDWEFDEGYDTMENLRIRQASSEGSRALHITLNTCIQPSSNVSNNDPPPPLRLYVSTSSDNQKPGLNSTSKDQSIVQANGGYARWTLNVTGDTYIGVFAPLTPSFQNIYNYEIAASIDAPYHSYNETGPSLSIVDTDSNSALLITDTIVQASLGDKTYQNWTSLDPPFVMFVHNQNDSLVQGLHNSYCGLKKYAQIAAVRDGENTSLVTMGMTTGHENRPREQFYVTGLNRSSSYFGFLAMAGNSTKEGEGVVGGGGKVWKSMTFATNSDGNCQVIFNLTFCDEVAYAVPSNPQNSSKLASWYDAKAFDYYQYFNYSLQQVACNTTSSAQYSLARNCGDCEIAYKKWLCAVTIPRCEDYSSTKTHLVKRNIAQSFINGSLPPDDSDSKSLLNALYANRSRNPSIDTEIKPGPYKEVLPCRDLCYSLVQSCPAVLQFGCPSGLELNRSYGTRSKNPDDLTCSHFGAASNESAGSTIGTPVTVLLIVVGLCLSYSL